jgi:type VI secretion system protein ImpC
MAPRGNQHQIGLDVSLGQSGESRPLDETPFRLAVLGDFSGRSSRGVLATGAEIAAQLPRRVDRDDLDEVLGELAPALHLAVAGPDAPRIVVRFQSLEDFHPDQLIDRVPLFKELHALRARLANPKTFADAAASLSRNPDQLSARPPVRPSAEGEEFRIHHPADGAGLLDAILGESSADPEAALAESGGDLHTFIQKILRPHLVPRPDPRQADLVAEVDAALGATMRTLLHHPDFLALEALWRGVDLLVRRVDTSAELQIHLVDLSAAELRLDLSNSPQPSTSGLGRLLVEASVEQPWSLIAASFTFGPDDEDLTLLGRLAALGHGLRAPWISAAAPALVGAPLLTESTDPHEWNSTPAPYWGALRHSADAPWLGLALPRYLVRLPYGRATEACERFPFEEWTADSTHDEYCWGNPALLVALLHAQAFADQGWRMAEDIGVEVDGLPLHLQGAEGATPVAEVLLPVKAAERIQQWGVMALASLKDQEAARFGRLQSVADPLAPLAGRWARQ